MLKIKAFLSNPHCQPRFGSSGAAAADLYSNTPSPVRLAPGASARIPTGLTLEIPDGYAGFIVPRSGLAAKYQIGIVNSPGLIDSDYRGEISVLLENRGRLSFVLEPEERFAQIVFIQVPQVEFAFVEAPEELLVTMRGAGGFGSTGQI